MKHKAFLQAARQAAWQAGSAILSLILLITLITACAPVSRPPDGAGGDGTPFLPPTQPALSTEPPANQPLPVSGSQPTPTVECLDNLTFRTDLTIPDGTIVGPDSTMDKRWEVENSGSCNWGENYQIRLIAGLEMGAKKEQALFPARSGSRATIRIQFKAPTEPGTYQSAWQAFNGRGEAFGDPFFIDIVVE